MQANSILLQVLQSAMGAAVPRPPAPPPARPPHFPRAILPAFLLDNSVPVPTEKNALGEDVELCKFFARAGWCKFAAECRHYHTADQPTAGSLGTSSGSRPPFGGPRPPRAREAPLVWPIFVGNIGYETPESEISDLFRHISGFKGEFKLGRQRDGNSQGATRGFGFAEFTDATSAIEAIKTVHGKEIMGRKLRLRWSEHIPTTPEVDDFHRGPEYLKTRLCYEVFLGERCPRGDDCPYAHNPSELRKLAGSGNDDGYGSSTAMVVRKPPENEGAIKLPIAIDAFGGDTVEERQRAAYTTTLGAGAKHVRFMIKRSGCRLMLRGAGCGAAGGDLEPLHLVVRPGMGSTTVTEEQLETVRKMLAEIAEGGAPMGLNDGAAAKPTSAGTTPPNMHVLPGTRSADVGEKCVMGSACPNLTCRHLHPRLPGLVPPVESTSTIRFFMVRSNTLANIQTSVSMGVCATTRSNTEIFQAAFEKSTHVVLIFSASRTGRIQGYARMTSAPSKDICPGLWQNSATSLGDSFNINWLKQCNMPFDVVDSLRNDDNQGEPIRKSREGQEVDLRTGEVLVRILYQQRDEDILSLPVEAEERQGSRSRSPRRDGVAASQAGNEEKPPGSW